MSSTWYKYDRYLSKNDSVEFDKTYKPGESVPQSGIYRCEGCDKRIAANAADPFPPQNHHQHNYAQGEIRWRLIVWA